MEKNIMSLNVRSGVLVKIFLSCTLYTSLYFAFFTDASKVLYVKLIFTNVAYIPLFGWACVLAYAFLWSRLFGEKFSGALAGSVLLGFGMHISTLLYKLNAQLALGSPLSQIYLYYIRFVTIGSLAVLFFASSYIIKQFFFEKDRKMLFFLPALYLFIHLSFRYSNLSGAIFHPALGLGLFLSYLVFLQKPFLDIIVKKAKWIMSDQRRLIIILFALGFLLRLAFSFQILGETGPAFVDGSDDGSSYDARAWVMTQDLAKAFKGGEVFPSYYDPGYILFLSFLYKIFGHNFYAVTFVQSVINGLLPVAVYLIAAILFSKSTGALSAIFVCLDQALIMHSVILGTEALFVTLLAFSLLFFLRYLKEPSRRINLYLIGIFLGIGIITRYMLMLIPLFMFFAVLFIKGRKLRNKLLDAILVYTIVFLFILPITLINYSNTKEFYLVEKSNKRIEIVWYEDHPAYEDISPGNRKLVEIGFDPLKKPLGSILVIFQKPVQFSRVCAELWSRRFVNFFCWGNYGFFDPLILVNPARHANEFGSTMQFYIFMIFIMGLWFSIKSIPKERCILVIFMALLYFVLIHVILFRVNTMRYRVVVIPYLFIIFSVGLYRIYLFILQGLKGAKMQSRNVEG